MGVHFSVFVRQRPDKEGFDSIVFPFCSMDGEN